MTEFLSVAVGIVTIVALFVQSGILWKWAGTIEATVVHHEKELERHEATVNRVATDLAQLAQIVARREGTHDAR